MVFNFRERRNSREATTVPPGIILRYVASGENDQATVHSYALASTAALFSGPQGLLYRQDVRIEPVGFQLFNVEVPYADKKHDTGSFQLSFDTTGGTVHITSSKQTIAAYGSGAAAGDHQQSIGVTGPDKDPEGPTSSFRS
jgi:hypothetical protein